MIPGSPPIYFPATEPVLSGRWRTPLLVAFGIAALTVFLYWPAVDFRLLAFDDPYYTQNDLVQGGWNPENIRLAFLDPRAENLYIPLSQLSYMIDVAVFGNAPRGFHLTNILLHSVNMAILFLLLWRMTGSTWKSALAAAIVAVHPLRVESVAWVTERKGVLSFFFLLLTMGCHLRFARTDRWRWHIASLVCALLGMLAKPMVVTLPVLLLLLDYWPLGRLRYDPGAPAGSIGSGRVAIARFLEKVPFFAMSLLVSLITLRFQGSQSLHPDVSILSRAEHSFSSFFIYLYQTAWPIDLSFRFFQTSWTRFSGTFLPAAAGLAFVTTAVVRLAPRKPYLLFGWLWFLASLFPVSGIVPTGVQWLSDRFTYVPHIGIAVAFAWLAGDLLSRLPRPALAALAMLVLVPLVVLTRRHLPHWKDGVSLFGNGIAANAGDPRYIAQYAAELAESGDLVGARMRLESVLPYASDPAFGVNIQTEYLLVLDKGGERSRAVRQAREFLRGAPGAWRTRILLADYLLAENRFAEAAQEYRHVAAQKGIPRYDRGYGYEGLGISSMRMGALDQASDMFREGLRIDPGSVSLRYNLARVLDAKGEIVAAKGIFEEALRIAPGNVRVRLEFAEALLRKGEPGNAARHLGEAARLAPGTAEGFYAMGRALEAAGRKPDAASFYGEALRTPAMYPDTADAARRRLGALR